MWYLLLVQNVEVKDFSHSFKNGLAFCAILHNYIPDAIPFDDLAPDNPKQNLSIAFEAAA